MSTKVPSVAGRLAVVAAVLLCACWAYADPTWTPAGDYNLSITLGGDKGTGTLSISPAASGFAVTRTATVKGTSTSLTGTATLRGRTLKVTFPVTADMVNRLDLVDRPSGPVKPITASYFFDGKGKFYGRVTNPSRVGGWTYASDSGLKGSTSALSIVKPATGGSFFPGQVVGVVTSPAGAAWSVTGPAERTGDGKLLFTGAGDVTLVATQGTDKSDPCKLRAVGLEVIEIEVQGALPIDDATPPHLQRQLGAATNVRKEPAAILLGQPLQLRVTVQGTGDLAEPFRVRLEGAAKDLKLSAEAVLDKLAAGQVVLLKSDQPVNDRVAVNSLDLAWSVVAGAKTFPAGPVTNLRVYTSFKPALKNINGPSTVTTKLHYEMACTWANGAARNTGKGSDSLGYNLDNQLRHYVHPKDYKKPVEVPAYAADAKPPLNYADLPGNWSVGYSGERGVSSLYYPPLEPHKDYEHYENFRLNFGWYLLDNPTHTGGRCNQQASLISDVLGTVGIKAEVYYLERTGVGKKTGRPCRNYFYAAGGSGPWNFHGLVRATMADGTQWLYDGSFSSPPNRLNGEQKWAEAPGGPFIQKWGPWYYEDYGGQVPADDIPTQWRGVQ